MSEWSEEEYKKEAKRLGWSVEFLKAHIQKEERIKEVFNKLKETMNGKYNQIVLVGHLPQKFIAIVLLNLGLSIFIHKFYIPIKTENSLIFLLFILGMFINVLPAIILFNII